MRDRRAPLPDWWWRLRVEQRRLIALTIVSIPVIVIVAWALWPSDQDDSVSVAADEAGESEGVTDEADAGEEETTASSAPTISLSDAQIEMWEQVAECETGGDWSANTGNGHYGGLQFTLTAWAEVGGHGSPDQAPAEEQMVRAQLLFEQEGWSPWPGCAAEIGG